MKRSLALLLSAIVFASPLATYGGNFKVQKQPYNIGGQQVSLESIVHEGKTYVELRKLADLSGLHITYIPDTEGGGLNRIMINEATSFRGHNIMVIYNVDRGEGFTYDYYNTHDEIQFMSEIPGVKELSTMPIKENGKYYLPIREIADIYGFKIDYINGKVVLKNKESLIVTDKERDFLKEIERSLDEYVQCECAYYGYLEEGIGHITAGGFLGDDSGVERIDFLHNETTFNNLLCYLVGVSSGACGTGDGTDISIRYTGSKKLRDKVNKFEKEQGGLITDTFRNCMNNLESILKDIETHQATPMSTRYDKKLWGTIEKYNKLVDKFNDIFRDPQHGLPTYDYEGLQKHIDTLF